MRALGTIRRRILLALPTRKIFDDGRGSRFMLGDSRAVIETTALAELEFSKRQEFVDKACEKFARWPANSSTCDRSSAFFGSA